jgi:23S rRNA (guanosine2251-2'-O)-methyltransferase
MTESSHPRDRFITIFGRKPVMEALADESLRIDKVLVSHTARGDDIDEIIGTARARNIYVKRVAPADVTRISKSGTQDQGVVADVLAPAMEPAAEWFARLRPDTPQRLLALDGLTTPANVGMIIRSAAASGMDGLILPRKGTCGLTPLVVKASAGTVFRLRILRCETLMDALDLADAAGFMTAGLEASGPHNLFETPLPRRAIYVVGNESLGLSDEVKRRLGLSLHISMANQIESLNAAVAASLLCFEAMRR